ncbi:hypothetical protein ACWDLG_14385 [Nonomuraea sp. NPDC003727]
MTPDAGSPWAPESTSAPAGTSWSPEHAPPGAGGPWPSAPATPDANGTWTAGAATPDANGSWSPELATPDANGPWSAGAATPDAGGPWSPEPAAAAARPSAGEDAGRPLDPAGSAGRPVHAKDTDRPTGVEQAGRPAGAEGAGHPDGGNDTGRTDGVEDATVEHRRPDNRPLSASPSVPAETWTAAQPWSQADDAQPYDWFADPEPGAQDPHAGPRPAVPSPSEPQSAAGPHAGTGAAPTAHPGVPQHAAWAPPGAAQPPSGAPLPPVPGAPYTPLPGAPQPPAPNGWRADNPGSAQPPNPGTPQASHPGIPQTPNSGTPHAPWAAPAGQAQTPWAPPHGGQPTPGTFGAPGTLGAPGTTGAQLPHAPQGEPWTPSPEAWYIQPDQAASTWQPPQAFTAAAAGMKVWPSATADVAGMPPWPAATGEPIGDHEGFPDGNAIGAGPTVPFAPNAGPDRTASHPSDTDPGATNPASADTGDATATATSDPGTPDPAATDRGHGTTGTTDGNDTTAATNSPVGHGTTAPTAFDGGHATAAGDNTDPGMTVSFAHSAEPGDVPVWPPHQPAADGAGDRVPDLPFDSSTWGRSRGTEPPADVLDDVLDDDPSATAPGHRPTSSELAPGHHSSVPSATDASGRSGTSPASDPVAGDALSADPPHSGTLTGGTPDPGSPSTAGPATAAPDTAEPISGATDTSGPDTSGPNAAGPDAHGPNAAGPGSEASTADASSGTPIAGRSDPQASGTDGTAPHANGTAAGDAPHDDPSPTFGAIPLPPTQPPAGLPALPAPTGDGSATPPAVPDGSSVADLPTPPHGAPVASFDPFAPMPQGGVAPAPEPPSTEPGKGKIALMATLGVLIVAGVATGGFFAYRSMSTAQPADSASAAPSAGPSTGDDPLASSLLNSEGTDPEKMSINEAFPDQKVDLGGRVYTRVKVDLSDDCQKAAAGPFATALRDQKCSRVLRATYVDDKKRYAVTTGIAVLPTKEAAVSADQAKDLDKNLWFKPLPGAASSGADRVHIAGGYAAGLLWGRYIVFSYATFADGHTPTAKEKSLGDVSGAFRDHTSLVLERRITE